MTPRAASPFPGGHTPVMLREVLEILAPRDGGIYVDATFGGGGYSRAILEAADCRLFAIDRDPAAITRGEELAQVYGGRLTMLKGSFSDMDQLLAAAAAPPADGIAFDLGISSFQLDEPERGFSFRFDGPLDMRMDTTGGRTAEEVVNTLPEEALAEVIFRYGEERKSRRIAKAIATARAEAPITRTAVLAEIVRRALGRRPGGSAPGIDPATRTFQALRIFVNDELGELRRGLQAAERRLAPSGRLAVVSFHSLEDRMVKDFLRERAGDLPGHSRHLPIGGDAASDNPTPSFTLTKRGAQKPDAGEAEANPRARSARLRGAVRTSAPAWPAETLGEGDAI